MIGLIVVNMYVRKELNTMSKFEVISNDLCAGQVFPLIDLDPALFTWLSNKGRAGVRSLSLSPKSGALNFFIENGAVEIKLPSDDVLRTMTNANWGFRITGKNGSVDLQYFVWLENYYANSASDDMILANCFTSCVGSSDFTPYLSRIKRKWLNCNDSEVFIWDSFCLASNKRPSSSATWRVAMARITRTEQDGDHTYMGLMALPVGYNKTDLGLNDLFDVDTISAKWGTFETLPDAIHVPTDPYHAPFPVLTQGPATLATEEDIKKDEGIYTHPDLHRRIKTDTSQLEGEVSPRKYEISVNGVDSYRTTTSYTHDEESVTREEP